MPLSRRSFVRAGAASGALVLASRSGVLATPLGPSAEFDTSRRSRLFPGTRLVHADLHNHTLFSDGDGDPELAFASMRAAGLDVAALTDHATVSKALGEAGTTCGPEGCDLQGIDEHRWQRTGALADAASSDTFTAIRGFEWSSPTLGHVNVWFSEDWTDPLSTVGNTTGEGIASYAHEVPGLGPVVSGPLDALVRATPATGTGMRPFYDWLSSNSDRPVLGGGLDGIAGFNHPGREPGRFGYFAYDARLRERLVSLEVFNRGEDYLFEGVDTGSPSPLPECLDAGWRVGLLGVTDEHGTDWGFPDGKGRAGLYVRELSRAGVREAMLARRFFSTRLRGLRFAATVGTVPMGGVLPHRSGTVPVVLDVDRGSAQVGERLSVQVLTSGRPLPTVVHAQDVTLPSGGGLIRFDVPLDVADGRWVVVRLSDPTAGPDSRAPEPYRAFGNGLAYASPVFLDPDAAPLPPGGYRWRRVRHAP